MRIPEKLITAITVLLAALLLLSPLTASGADKPQPPQAFQFKKDRQVQQVRPKKPVRIKLHRAGKGDYSWDLTGDDADEVVRTDKRLRKMLNLE